MKFNSLFFKVTFFLLSAFSLNGFGQASLPVSRTAWGTTPTGWTDNGTHRNTSFACSGSSGGSMQASGKSYKVFFSGVPDQLKYAIKGSNATSSANFRVQESVDGTTWTDVATYTSITGSSCINETKALLSTSRYVQFIFVTKGTGNVDIDDVEISAGAVVPTITVSPASLSGLDYQVGNGPSDAQTFVTSGSNLTNDIVLTAPTNFEISTSISGPFSSSLTLTQASGSVAATTIYTQLASGLAINTYSGNVTLTSTGATSLTVALSGAVTPTMPEINVQGNGIDIVDGSTTPSLTNLTSFTSVCASSGNVTNVYTIFNDGLANLTITSLALSGANAADFAISGIVTPATILPDASTTFSVTFDPSVVGSRLAVLTINNNDADEAVYNFNIQGSGIAAAAITTQPASASATISTSASFSVVATSASSYTWQEGISGVWTNITDGGYYSGASTASLTISNPGLAMSGYTYRVIVANSCGSLTSNGAAVLTVNTGPCLSENFTAGTMPTGWTSTSVTITSSLAEFGANNGDLTTIAIANPSSLEFDISRTAHGTAKTFNILVSTTSQSSGFSVVASYDHSNTINNNTTHCTVDLSAYVGFSTVYIQFQKVGTNASPWRLDNIEVFCNSTAPSISRNPSFLLGLSYVEGTGPSAAQGFSASGINLTNDIVINAPSNFEIATTLAGPYSSSITLVPSSGTVPVTSIYTRLIAGLPVNAYSGTITLSSTPASSLTVTLNGSVTSLVASVGTSFRPGDLVYVAYDGQEFASGSDDGIYIMNMIDILPETSFSHVNSRFEAGAAACTRTMRWGGAGNAAGLDPGILTFKLKTTATTIPAGSIIKFITSGSSVATILVNGVNKTSDFTVTNPGGQGANISNADPDQMYLVQGTFSGLGTGNVQLTGNVLYAFTNGSVWIPFSSAVSSGSAKADRQSRLHPDLECFNFESAAVLGVAYYKLAEIHTGTKRALLGSIGNPSNWTNTGSSIPTAVTTTTFSISGSNAPGTWVGDASSNFNDWFTCGNWEGLAVPDRNLDVLIPNVTNFARIDVDGYSIGSCAGSFTSDKYLVAGVRMAECKSLTIDGETLEFGKGSTNSGSVNDRLDIYGNLTINNTANGILDMDAGTSVQDGTINLQGNWVNNLSEAAFIQGNGTVNFVQSNNQTVNTASFNEVFANLGINKSGGSVTLNTPAEIEQSANYISGLINTNSTNLLIFRDNATHTNVSNASFTNGPVRKIGNDAFTFPIGKPSVYAPASISAPGSVTDHFTAEYFGTNPSPTYNNTLKDVTIDHLSICEYWMINRTNGASNVTVNLSWNTPRSCGVNSLPDMLVARWDGAMWKNHGNGGTTGAAAAGSVTTAAAVTAFSPFTLGSASVLNPLPIVVNKFEALKNENKVDLLWTVSNNNRINYFEIWSSVTGKDFKLLDKVNANNKYLTNKNYTTVDYNPAMGINYYKLKVVDANGKVTFSDIKSVNFELNNEIYIYPNPIDLGNDLFINLQLIEDTETVEVTFIDQIGKLVLANKYIGENTITINTAQLAKGVYYVKVKTNNKIVTQKLIII